MRLLPRFDLSSWNPLLHLPSRVPEIFTICLLALKHLSAKPCFLKCCLGQGHYSDRIRDNHVHFQVVVTSRTQTGHRTVHSDVQKRREALCGINKKKPKFKVRRPESIDSYLRGDTLKLPTLVRHHSNYLHELFYGRRPW